MIRRLLLPVAVLPGTLLLLAGALVAPALAGGGCHGGAGAEASEASSTVIKVDGCAFAPTISRVPVGTEVTFLNSGLGPHDVTGTMGEWGSKLLEPGETYRTRFARPGVYAFSCSLHPGMAGVIVAGAGEGAQDDPGPPAEVMAVASPDAAPDDAAAPTSTVLAGAVGLVFGSLGTGVLIAARRRSA